jgi:ATP-dependent DNA helicase RecG
MKASIEKLRKYFRQEAKQGYQNRAVIGGLERMLKPWAAEARSEQLPENLIQAVIARLRDYHALSEHSRKEALTGLWKRILRELGEDVAQPPTKTALSPQPPPAEAKTPPQTTEPAPKPRPRLAPKDIADLNSSVTSLKNIGPRYAERLARLGIKTLGDMLYHFPHRHDDYSEMKPINKLRYGEKVTLIGTIQSAHKRKVSGGRRTLVEAVVSDGSGAMRITWFNQPWLAKKFKPGEPIVISGETDQYLGRLTMTNPSWSPVEEEHLMSKGIVPIYPLTEKVSQRWLREKIHTVVEEWAPKVPDALPDWIKDQADLPDLSAALKQIHFPDSWEDLNRASYRLAFDEIFFLQLGVLQQKFTWNQRSARSFEASDKWIQAQLERLPFELTQAQQKALAEVRADLASGHPMNRLLQGDVGSGKTVVAAMAVAIVAKHGGQAAIMAPTSILAEQHYHSLSRMLTEQAGFGSGEIRLMIGATPDEEKEAIRAGLAAGEIKLVVGTHALIEDPVEFANLQLAIIDEQHRFGVNQRAALREKGENPHLMVMTATPIPRSLALTVYGDLDLSVIDEMPPGRKDVGTHILYPRERERAYGLIQRQIEAGKQAFIIYPLVEESDKSEEMAAVEEHARLKKEVFTHAKLGLLHGRLAPDEKETVMAKFRDGEYDILVSTSVVEVGVDVPNATVMLIEGANRFGLAQLHQLRGRVGRGSDQAYCILIPSNPEDVENERLQAMAATNDGFKLAERDLEQRGPGEFLGTRQSGYAELQMASLMDINLIEKARRYAQKLFEKDPDLTRPEHQYLAEAIERFWKQTTADIS